MKKRAWLSMMVFVLVVGLLSACGDKVTSSNGGDPSTGEPPVTNEPTTPVTPPSTDDPGTGTGTGEGTGTSEPSKEPSNVEKKSETIKVYVSDDQLMELVSYSKEIQYANEEEKLQAALDALQNADESKYIALWKHIKFNSFKLDDQGLLTIDVTLTDKGHLGAGGESFAIDALTSTLFQFSEVKSINILVDGQEAESLMGHVTLDHPIKRP